MTWHFDHLELKVELAQAITGHEPMIETVNHFAGRSVHSRSIASFQIEHAAHVIPMVVSD